MRSKLSKKIIISIRYAIIISLSLRIKYEINAPFKDIE